jgi:ubiquinone/menaquinone biosynthesis C-methylase UbiE
MATDKEGSMLQLAASKINNDEVNFQLADSQQLPFEDQAFELIICQFGFMFFGEKEKAFSEAFRTLRHGAQLLFNVWDQIKWNEISFITDRLVKELTGKTADQRKGPYSFYDEDSIRQFLIQAGFTSITSKKVVKETKDPDPELIYNGVILGSPLATYLKSHQIPESEIKNKLIETFKPVSGASGKAYKMQALVFSAKK